MRILNKEQFAKTPAGTVFCTFTPDVLSEELFVKLDYKINQDNEPTFYGVIPVCPYFEMEMYECAYSGMPSETRSYYTQCLSTDTGLSDFDDNTLFAVFSKAEIDPEGVAWRITLLRLPCRRGAELFICPCLILY